MDKKIIIAAVVILIFIGFYAYIHSGKIRDLLNRPKDSLHNFAKSVEKANKVIIVEDVSNTKDPYRQNIMQCGVDYATSVGAIGKNISVYILENGICYTLEKGESKKLSEGECLHDIESQNAPIIYIEKGEGIGDSYKDLLYVKVGENYTRGECSILPANGVQ